MSADRDDLSRLLKLGRLIGCPTATVNDMRVRDLICGRRVLITGAGGSIGAELARQIAVQRAAHITLLDNSEFNLYCIDRHLMDNYPEISRATALCDIRDRALISSWFERENPEIIFHTAAIKHVSIAEEHTTEAVRTNILGTQNVADIGATTRARVVVLVSTDKAAGPVSIMGATKRCAEAYCQALDIEQGVTRFICVRFCNVLGSSGSVVPLFQQQIVQGGPITLTHPDASRYFVTLTGAVSHLLQAATLRDVPKDLRGVVHIMDSGARVRIADLAKLMIQLAGPMPNDAIEIQVTGLKAGEKLHEILVDEGERLLLRTADGFTLVRARTSGLEDLRQNLSELKASTDDFNDPLTRRLLRRLVRNYSSAVGIDADP